jgi:hypothetical protein
MVMRHIKSITTAGIFLAATVALVMLLLVMSV